ncbi:transposon-encoded TnpW family protein [Anaerotignum sp.]|uniref:transposon-encoded TnpW family protein n=1 Tax=Anaerotignum sp. TaxID=2039241 RepID=UPI0028A8E628|nr:transposon-encoded TnpW family protein [Anaerotignum sp.]
MQTPTENAANQQSNKPLRLTKRIGSTTYKVSVHFSKTSKETMGDKILRLIEKDKIKQ